jgi:inner membrane protein
MPSVFSHAIAAVAIGAVAVGGPSRLALWGLGTLCAVVPDMDVIGLLVGIPYRHMLGHRGLSHSLLFAAALASVVTAGARWKWPAGPSGARLWTYFFLATASHGLLDAMTNGGLGVAFFAPFSGARYRFPWRPIVVSPISIGEFVGPRGLRVMWSEIAWVWLPAALIVLARLAITRRLPGPAVETRPGRASSGAREHGAS